MKNNNAWTYKKISSSHIHLMRLIALLPFEGKKFNDIGHQLLSAYMLFIIFIYNTSQTAYGIRMIANKKIEIDYICEKLPADNITFRYLILYFKRKQLLILMEMCEEMWSYISPQDIKIVRYYERKAYYFRNFSLISTLIAATFFIVSAQSTKLISMTFNETTTKVLPFRYYIEIHEEPAYTITTIFQIIYIFTTSIILTGIDSVPLYLIMMSSGYLKSLQKKLLSLIEVDDNVQFNNKNSKNDNVKNLTLTNEYILKDIQFCANFHQKIMLFCEELEKFLRSVYFITVFFTIYNLSILGINMIEDIGTSKFTKWTTLFVMNTFQFFICQWAPEYLLTESRNIANAAYFANMREMSYQREANKILCFMTFRAQKPIQLTAGGYVQLSMRTFATMVKSAFSFFTVLHNIK